MFKNRLIPLYRSVVVFFIMVNAVFADAHLEKININEALNSADRSRGNLKGLEWNVKTITVEQGKKDQTLKFKLLTKSPNSLVKFTSPSRMRGQMILMRSKNMWFIRPGLRKPVAISPRQRLTGAASNGDIASTNYAADYNATLLGEEILNGEPCYVLELLAKNKEVTYDKIKYWVSKKDTLGKHAEFYTVSGKLFKKATFEYGHSVVKNKLKIPFISNMVITDTNSSIKTTLYYTDIIIKDIANATFNLNLLVR